MIKYNAVQAEHASRAEITAQLAENRVSGNRREHASERKPSSERAWQNTMNTEWILDSEAGRRRRGVAAEHVKVSGPYSTRQRTRGAHLPV